MNLLNLIEDANTGYDNLRALMQAVQNSQDAVLNVGSEPITLTYPEARFMFGKYKAYNKAGRQEEFINDLGDPVKFDLHMKQLRQLLDKQKNFRGSVPGERGVTGDVPPMAEAEPVTVEEIAMNNPDRPTTETAGRINWERMIKDYMDNKPYSEFEFGVDRSLTLYRSQVYAILKDFGRMKPQQKVSIILNIFGDKTAMVDYLDKLRAKGMMPKKVPAYVNPGVEPVPPGQMSFPGMASPKIKEAQAQKKNSNQAELGRDTARSPKVQRAFQLARARQAAAGSDIEAFVKDELEKSEQAQVEIEQLRSENDRQDQQIQQLAAKVRQQDQEINQVQQPTAATPAKAEPPKEKPKAAEPDKKSQPVKKAEPKAAEKSAEPARRDEPRAEPAPAKTEKPTKVDQPKPDDTQIQRPRPEPVEVPANVLQFPTTAQRKKNKKAAAAQVDPVAAAMQGVDISDMGRAVGMNESSEELHMGDPVIIRGNVEHSGKTGDVAGFGRDKHFVIVDLYNFGQHAFHASNVEYNNHDDYIDEGTVQEMQTKLDRVNINQPPPGGTNQQREAFLDARDRLFRQMQNANPGEKEAIRLKIVDLEGQAQANGIKIREAGEFNRSGYNAIRDVSDWEEKMRVMQELMKDQMLMSDPEAKAAIQQRIGDLIRVGQQQGYINEALNDKAMAVLRGLKSQPQATQPTALNPAQQAEVDSWAQDVERNLAPKLKKQSVSPAIDLNVPRPQTAQDILPDDLPTLRRRIEQLDQLIKMKEMIDKLFLKAQNARGGIYPGLQSDIEDEELYGVPQTDQEYQTLKDKYTKDLTALQKFLAMKKAVYREGQDRVSESTALVRLKQARQALSQQGVSQDQLDEINWRKGLATAAMAAGAVGAMSSPTQARVMTGPDGQATPSFAQQMQSGAPASSASSARMPNQDLQTVDTVTKVSNDNFVITHNNKEYQAKIIPIDFKMIPRGGVKVKVTQAQMGERGLGSYVAYLLPNGTAIILSGLPAEPTNEATGDDVWGPQGNFAGDTKVNIGGASLKAIQVGDTVKYFGEKARVEQVNPANNIARISANGKTWNVRLSDLRSLGQGLKEFAPAGRDPWGDDDRGEDPYGRPQPRHYNRSVDYFSQFEADHFDREDFNDATGVFKGYWGDDQIAYFKFDNPQRNGSDDPGMGWYYEPQNESVAEDAESIDREFHLVKKLGRLGERIVQSPKLWDKYSEVVESDDPDWIISLIMDGTGATFNEVLRLSDLFGEIGGGLGRIIDFAWSVKEGHWERDFMEPYRKHRSQGVAEGFFGGTAKTAPGQLKIYAVYDGFTVYYDPAKEMFVTAGTGEYKDKFRARGFPALSAMGGVGTAIAYGEKMTGGQHKQPISMDRSVVGGAHESVAEAQTDYSKRRQRERDVDAGKPVTRQPKNPQNDYFARRKKEKKHDMDEAISKKDLLNRLQKDLPKVNDPKNKDAKPVVWAGPGKDDYGYTGYQGHGMPTDKQERELARKKKGVAESLKPGEYHVHTVYFKDGTKKRVRVTSDEFDVVGYYNKRGQAVDRVDYDFQIHSNMTEQTLDEKQDACYNKVKSRYKVWPSAYASGALVQCRKKGADNWGEGGKKK